MKSTVYSTEANFPRITFLLSLSRPLGSASSQPKKLTLRAEGYLGEIEMSFISESPLKNNNKQAHPGNWLTSLFASRGSWQAVPVKIFNHFLSWKNKTKQSCFNPSLHKKQNHICLTDEMMTDLPHERCPMPFTSEPQMPQMQLLKTIIFFLIVMLFINGGKMSVDLMGRCANAQSTTIVEKSSLHCPVEMLAVYSSQQPGLVSTTCAAHASSGHILTDRQHYQAIFGKQEDHTDECVSAETFKTCLLPCLESCVATVWCFEGSKYTL